MAKGEKRKREDDGDGPDRKKGKNNLGRGFRQVVPNRWYLDGSSGGIPSPSQPGNRAPHFMDVDPIEVNDEDEEWLPHIPEKHRPQQFPLTWTKVYKDRRPIMSAADVDNDDDELEIAAFQIRCKEGCGFKIYMDGSFCEIDPVSTPHGRRQKPPVCHDIPWAALRARMVLQERQSGFVFTRNFIRSVCWDTNNLRPGHSGCNAAGMKTTTVRMTDHERREADNIIQRMITKFTSENMLYFESGESNLKLPLSLQGASTPSSPSPSFNPSPSSSFSSPSPSPSPSGLSSPSPSPSSPSPSRPNAGPKPPSSFSTFKDLT